MNAALDFGKVARKAKMFALALFAACVSPAMADWNASTNVAAEITSVVFKKTLPVVNGTSSFSVSSDVSWAHGGLSSQSANGYVDVEVAINMDANTSGSARTATFTTKAYGNNITLTATQRAAGASAGPVWTIESGVLTAVQLNGATEIEIPSAVEEIGEKVFSHETGLVAVSIPSSVKRIGDGAFAWCTALEDVSLEEGLVEICQTAFAGCKKLQRVEFPASLSKIGMMAFYNSGLLRLDIPANVAEIGLDAFGVCRDMWMIIVDDANPRYAHALGGGAIVDRQTSTLLQVSAYSSGEVAIPDGIKVVAPGAFDTADGVTSAIVPSSVTEIGSIAFSGCSKLAAIYFEGNAPQCADDAFENIAAAASIYVRKSSSGWGVSIPGTWKGVPIQYAADGCQVSFNANGGAGNMAAQAFPTGSAQALAACTFTKQGCVFAGWAAKQNGDAVYTDKQTASFMHDTTLYAVWAVATPTGFTASTGRTDGVYLQWDESSVDDATYFIFRSTSPDPSTMDRLPYTSWLDEPCFLDTTAQAGVQYYYWVCAGTTLMDMSGYAGPAAGARAAGASSRLSYASAYSLAADEASPFIVPVNIVNGGFSVNSGTFSTSASWIRYSGYSCSGSDMKIKFAVDGNSGATARTAVFTGTICGEAVSIAFTQAAGRSPAQGGGGGQGQGGEQGQSGGETPQATARLALSKFTAGDGAAATISGLEGITWSGFSSSDYFGAVTMVRADIPDAEKSLTGFSIETMGAEDGWCGPLSDMDALYWSGWAQEAGSQYATVEDMADYFRAQPSLLRTWNYGPVEGTYGYDGFFRWFHGATGVDPAAHISSGDVQSAGFAQAVETLLGDGSHVMRLDLLFSPVVSNPKWTWANPEGTLHAVLCVGFAVDASKPAGDPARLTALFIVDPDNDQSTGSGGRAAPDSIVYCPVVWNGSEFAVSGIWGQSATIYGQYSALECLPRVPAATEQAQNSSGGAASGGSAAPASVAEVAAQVFEAAAKVESEIAQSSFTASPAQRIYNGVLLAADGMPAGAISVTVGKVNAKSGLSNVKAAITWLDGKKSRAKAVKVRQPLSGALAERLEVKGYGTLAIVLDDSRVAGSLSGYSIVSADVGGDYSGFAHGMFALDDFVFPSGGTPMDEFLPDGAEFDISGKKWVFAKAPPIKMKKGEFDYAAYEKAWDKGKTNDSGLKLTYTPKTGVFKGSFNIYAVHGEGAKAKVKKTRVKVSGVVVNGIGWGKTALRNAKPCNVMIEFF